MHTVDLKFLQIDSLNSSVKRLFDQNDENNLCQTTSPSCAKWWNSKLDSGF